VYPTLLLKLIPLIGAQGGDSSGNSESWRPWTEQREGSVRLKRKSTLLG